MYNCGSLFHHQWPLSHMCRRVGFLWNIHAKAATQLLPFGRSELKFKKPYTCHVVRCDAVSRYLNPGCAAVVGQTAGRLPLCAGETAENSQHPCVKPYKHNNQQNVLVIIIINFGYLGGHRTAMIQIAKCRCCGSADEPHHGASGE